MPLIEDENGNHDGARHRGRRDTTHEQSAPSPWRASSNPLVGRLGAQTLLRQRQDGGPRGTRQLKISVVSEDCLL
jgi:hypothetical protein